VTDNDSSIQHSCIVMLGTVTALPTKNQSVLCGSGCEAAFALAVVEAGQSFDRSWLSTATQVKLHYTQQTT
jgi:hypothetical protein